MAVDRRLPPLLVAIVSAIGEISIDEALDGIEREWPTIMHEALEREREASAREDPSPAVREARRCVARSVTDSLGVPFRVRGGPFASEQTMGWHLTDENGFTLAVSCDKAFVDRVLRWQAEAIEHEAAEARRLMGCE